MQREHDGLWCDTLRWNFVILYDIDCKKINVLGQDTTKSFLLLNDSQVPIDFVIESERFGGEINNDKLRIVPMKGIVEAFSEKKINVND